MRIIVPVTDYIPASLLTTPDDIVIRGAAVIERSQGMLKAVGVSIGNSTRDSSGDQVISGVGFEPAVVLFFANDSITTNMNFSIGFDDGLVHHACMFADNGSLINLLQYNSIYVRRDDSNRIFAEISSKGNDGFTLSWQIAGACACEYFYLCLP